MGLFVGGFGYAGEKEIKKQLLDNGMYDENGSYNGFNKIDTKKPLNNKLDENLDVLTEDLLVFYENNLYKFALMSKLGKGNICNIISEGKIVTYRSYSNSLCHIIIPYLDYTKKFFDGYPINKSDICGLNILTEDQKLLVKQDKIKIADLLSIENQLNENEIAKQNEKNEIRMGYGF